jgi:GT2 family glycosyltransferase
LSVSTTIIVTNWRRPANVVEQLKFWKQSTDVDVRVFIWDNAGNDAFRFRLPDGVPEPDLLVVARENWFVFARWLMVASLVQTNTFIIWDDDLIPLDSGYVYDAVNLATNYPDCLFGSYGVDLVADKPYRDCQHFNANPSRAWVETDIVKGRIVIGTTGYFRGKFHINQGATLPELNSRAEDIVVSSWYRRDQKIIPGKLSSRRLRNLSQQYAASGQPTHYAEREAIRRAVFG